MNSFTQKPTPTQHSLIPQTASALDVGSGLAHMFLLTLLGLTCLLARPLLATDTTELTQKAEDAARQKATAAAEQAKDFWEKIDAARLKNRTPDQIVAWVIMGLLVASVAGMMTSLKPTGAGLIGRLLLGLTGAFIGGIIVNVRNFDFGWGPVLIRYEELLFSFVGALLIVLLPKIIAWKFKKKALKH